MALGWNFSALLLLCVLYETIKSPINSGTWIHKNSIHKWIHYRNLSNDLLNSWIWIHIAYFTTRLWIHMIISYMNWYVYAIIRIHIWIHVNNQFIWSFHSWFHVVHEFIYEVGGTKVPSEYQLASSCLSKVIKSHLFEWLFKKNNGFLAVSGTDQGLELTTSTLRQNSSWACIYATFCLPCINFRA